MGSETPYSHNHQSMLWDLDLTKYIFVRLHAILSRPKFLTDNIHWILTCLAQGGEAK